MTIGTSMVGSSRNGGGGLTGRGRRGVRLEDRARIGGINGGVGLRGTRADPRWDVVLEVRQGGMLGVRGEPRAPQLLHDAAPPDRASNEAPAPGRLEVGHG